jgi:hypothetical protein
LITVFVDLYKFVIQLLLSFCIFNKLFLSLTSLISLVMHHSSSSGYYSSSSSLMYCRFSCNTTFQIVLKFFSKSTIQHFYVSSMGRHPPIPPVSTESPTWCLNFTLAE